MKTHADSSEPDRIDYLNFPPLLEETYPRIYENFSKTISRLNDRLRRSPIRGRILNVETLRVKCKDGLINDHKMERSAWTNFTSEKLPFVMFVRLFYLRGSPQGETIGVKQIYHLFSVFSPTNYILFFISCKRFLTKSNKFISITFKISI